VSAPGGLLDFDGVRGGWALTETWELHVARCERCASYDPRRPATLAGLCLQGVALLKSHYAEQHASQRGKKRAPR
jgi:hypothetical protein